MVQALVGTVVPSMANNRSWLGNMAGTTVAVAGWGFFVYQGVVDPLGGINTLWPLFGIGNQMLASMALILGTVVLFKMKKQRYAWVTIVPTAWLFITSMTAGWQKIFHEKPSIGFLAQANKFRKGIDDGIVIAPAKTVADMQTIVFSNQINAALCAFFMLVAVTMLVSAFFVIRRALNSSVPTTHESEISLRKEVRNV
jgi:carbon starvation protein